MESLHKNLNLVLEFLKALFLVMLFSYYTLDLSDGVIYIIAIYADNTTLYCKSDQASDLWQQRKLTFELESDPQDTVEWGRKWLVDFFAGKTQLVSVDSFKITGAFYVKMNGSVLKEKSSFKMLGLSVCYKLDWGL